MHVMLMTITVASCLCYTFLVNLLLGTGIRVGSIHQLLENNVVSTGC